MKSLFVFLLFLIPTISIAAPDEFTSYAMSTPISIHDFAIFKTKTELNKNIFDEDFPYNEVIQRNLCFIDLLYDYDKNEYTILSRLELSKKPNSINTIQKMAKDMVTRCKNKVGVFDIKGEMKAIVGGHSFFSGNFSHAGYISNKRPKNIESEIDKKTKIDSIIAFYSGYEYKEFTCSSQLLSTKIYCSE